MSLTPYYQDEAVTIYCGDCREILPLVEADHIVTDPPYGFHKADWDDAFPIDWLQAAATAARKTITIMPGINNILSLPREIPPFEYRWMLAIHLTNGMTRGLMGFGNWIPALVYAKPGDSLYKPQQDCADIPVVGSKPYHPSPKPLRAMTWILERLPEGSVLDPFMGSGTMLLAAKELGRKAIGIEIEERYCEIAAKRMSQEVLPLGVR